MPRPDARKSYHHGDLRSALVAAAERLMIEHANWTFTLREVARAAGVSHNAPYNHFPDRIALLAAVAARGFDDLTAALLHELEKVGTADIAAGVRATARAYVAFAAKHPSRYRLIFSAELASCEDTTFRAAERRAFAVLRELIARGVVEGRLRADPHGTHALTAWSLMHGLGTLVVDGRVPVPAGDGALAALTDRVASTLVDGLDVPRS